MSFVFVCLHHQLSWGGHWTVSGCIIVWQEITLVCWCIGSLVCWCVAAWCVGLVVWWGPTNPFVWKLVLHTTQAGRKSGRQKYPVDGVFLSAYHPCTTGPTPPPPKKKLSVWHVFKGRGTRRGHSQVKASLENQQPATSNWQPATSNWQPGASNMLLLSILLLVVGIQAAPQGGFLRKLVLPMDLKPFP